MSSYYVSDTQILFSSYFLKMHFLRRTLWTKFLSLVWALNVSESNKTGLRFLLAEIIQAYDLSPHPPLSGTQGYREVSLGSNMVSLFRYCTCDEDAGRMCVWTGANLVTFPGFCQSRLPAPQELGQLSPPLTDLQWVPINCRIQTPSWGIRAVYGPGPCSHTILLWYSTVTLGQHGSELHGPTHTWVFPQ